MAHSCFPPVPRHTAAPELHAFPLLVSDGNTPLVHADPTPTAPVPFEHTPGRANTAPTPVLQYPTSTGPTSHDHPDPPAADPATHAPFAPGVLNLCSRGRLYKIIIYTPFSAARYGQFKHNRQRSSRVLKSIVTLIPFKPPLTIVECSLRPKSTRDLKSFQDHQRHFHRLNRSSVLPMSA